MGHFPSRFLRLVIAVVTVAMVAGCMDASLSQSGVGPARISILQAPAGVSEVSLTISGPGMSTISETLSPTTDAVVLEIPIGPDRVFEASAGGYSARVVRAVTAGGLTVELSLWVAAEGTLLFARGTYNDTTGELTQADLYTIDPGGVNEQRLTNLSIPITGFGWTPGGEWIVLISALDDTNGELYRLRADGTEFARLTNNTAAETIGGIEPNGTRLAYAYDPGNGPSVFAVDTAAPTPVETEIAVGRGFTFSQDSIEAASDGTIFVSADVVDAWSPDGTSVLYSSNEPLTGDGLNGRLYFTPDGGQTETPISTQAEAAVGAQWFPDGSGVVYAETDTGDPADMDIYRYDVAEQSSTQLTDSPLLDRSLELSPDGTTVLFERFDPFAQFGGSEYRLVDVFSGSETALTSATDFIPIYARWITGSNEIAALGVDATTFAVQLRIISSSGTELQIIENSQLAEGFPAQWSPDGRTASVMVDQSGDGSGEFDLFLFSRDSGGLSRITDTPEAEIGGYWRP